MGREERKSRKNYDTYMAAMAAPTEAVVDVDVPTVVVASAVVEVPPRSCVNIFKAAPQAGRLLVRSRRVTAMLPRLLLMLK